MDRAGWQDAAFPKENPFSSGTMLTRKAWAVEGGAGSGRAR